MNNQETYSFSRLSTIETCPKSFEYKYVLGESEEGNWFSDLGSFGHLLLELYDRGKIKNLGFVYRKYLRKRVQLPTFTWAHKWEQQCQDFFDTFNGWSSDAVWIEKYLNFPIDDFNLQGFVDRASYTKRGFTIVDYKVANVFKGDKLRQKARQLYLYAYGTKQEIGEYPRDLIFYHFRQKTPVIIPFKEKDMIEAVDWAKRMVEKIRTEKEYKHNFDKFFCENICSFRKICTFGEL